MAEESKKTPAVATGVYAPRLQGDLLVPNYRLSEEQKEQVKRFREMVENDEEIAPLNDVQVRGKRRNRRAHRSCDLIGQ